MIHSGLMATKNQRLMTVLDPPVYAWLRAKSRRDGISLSLAARDLLRKSYEEDEDRLWAEQGERRLRGFVRSRAVSHDRAWTRRR